MLAKHFGEGYYIRQSNKDEKGFNERLQEFLDKHHECRELNHFDPDVFELNYE